MEIDGALEVRQWVTTSLRESTKLRFSEEFNWARVMAYVRSPSATASGFVFGELSEAYELRSSGRYLLRMTNGLSLTTAAPLGGGPGADAEELSLVYSMSVHG